MFSTVRHKHYNPAAIITIYYELCDAIELINDYFTFPLNFIIFQYFIMNLFATFNVVWTVSKRLNDLFFVISTDGTWVLASFIFQSFMVHISSKTTQEAERTAGIVGKIINTSECCKAHQNVFKKYLLQNQYRNFKLQTSFFTINWKLMLTVSCLILKNIFYKNLKHILQIISTTITYLVITCQFDPPKSWHTLKEST